MTTEQQDLHIRLVPRTRSGASRTAAGTILTPYNTATFAADPGHAQGAAELASRMGSVSLSSRNTVGLMASPNAVADQFKAELVTREHEIHPRREGRAAGSVHQSDKYISVRPGTRLEVPDELREVVEFAYIPTPPDFLATPSAVPPSVALHHFRLADVSLMLGGRKCQRRGWTGKGVRVAMPDTGFARHAFLEASGYNITRVSTPGLGDPTDDSSGHGTGECANIFAVAPDCRVIGVKHSDYSAVAMETALAQAPQIITNSWGWDVDYGDFASFEQWNPNLYLEALDLEGIINDALADGIVIIFSAGNGQKAFPGCMPDVLSIGGAFVDETGAVEASSYASSFSSQLYPGRHVPDVCGIVGRAQPPPMEGHIMLPVPLGSTLEGENMSGSAAKEGWGIFSGTSASAPQVAGAVAMLFQLDATLQPSDVRQVLQNTARDVMAGTSAHGEAAGPGPDSATGFGLIDAYAAGQLIAG